MRVIVQRALDASVEVDKEVIGEIKKGLMLLVGFTEGDNKETIVKMINKIINLRIFEEKFLNRFLLLGFRYLRLIPV